MSMFPTIDPTYNNQKIGKYQGADFAFFNTAVVAAEEMDNFMRSMFTITHEAISDSVLANSLFSPGYGYHYYSAPTGQSKCSMYWPVASQGMRLVVDCTAFAGDANLVLSNATGGGTLKMPSGSTVSYVNVSAAGYLEMICTTDGTWSISQINASATPSMV